MWEKGNSQRRRLNQTLFTVMVIAFAVGSFESGTFFRIIDVCVTAVYIYRQVVYRAAEKQQFFPFSIRHVYYGPEGNKSLPKVCII